MARKVARYRRAHGVAALHLLDDDRADRLRLVKNLTVQAVHAFVRVDLSRWVDRLNGALVGAGLARMAAFTVALEPIEHAQPRWDRQRRAEGAEIAAVEPLHEKPRRQEGQRIG